MSELEIIIETGKESTSWYNTSLGAALIGGIFSIIIACLTLLIRNKLMQKKEKRNFMLLLLQNNSKIFHLIFMMSLNPKDVRLIDFWTELEKANLIYLLPLEIKELFIELHDLRNSGIDNYDKEDVTKICKKIVNKIEEYGVKSFGFR